MVNQHKGSSPGLKYFKKDLKLCLQIFLIYLFICTIQSCPLVELQAFLMYTWNYFMFKERKKKQFHPRKSIKKQFEANSRKRHYLWLIYIFLSFSFHCSKPWPNLSNITANLTSKGCSYVKALFNCDKEYAFMLQPFSSVPLDRTINIEFFLHWQLKLELVTFFTVSHFLCIVRHLQSTHIDIHIKTHTGPDIIICVHP